MRHSLAKKMCKRDTLVFQEKMASGYPMNGKIQLTFCFFQVWDIRVGKVLTEFGDHRGPVTAVEFHPHEFLLASGSLDRTVKFWELETFSQISSSHADVPPVRCIAFHPSGACLFSASSEILRVHGWEPPETFDSVPTSWTKIQDIAISHDQLV